ncbi:MAG: site-specific DNA-methyltransferase [Clostridiales bacterium]|mgnify:CR=1 FL=1|nr:site-specific DNA-methyltransferase [Clostridiales bacterium]
MINKIIEGDSIELIKKIESESIHAIISDIPYGIGYDEWDILHTNTNSALGGSSIAQQESGNLFKRRGKPLNGWSEADKKIPIEYQEWCSSWACDWLRVLKPGASCFIFAGRRYAHRCIVALEDAGFTFKDMLCWEKNRAPHRAQRISSVYDRRSDPINAQKWMGWRLANLRPLFEPILWFQKPYKTGGTIADNVLYNGVGAWNETALELYNNFAEIYKIQSNIIKVKTDKDDQGYHVAQKPLRLMELLIHLVTLEQQIILDPFVGSGTTCVAAKKLGRNYIGFEIDPKIAKAAQKRLGEETVKQLNMSEYAGRNVK